MPQYRIPFNRACFVGTEQGYISEAVAGGHISGDGSFTRRCSALLADALGTERVLLTTSCTHALELAALALDVGPGDEVIVPSYTFVSTANAFALRGASIVFADVRADTQNLDESLLAGLVNDRTKVIVPVHYGGVACEMDAITELADANGVAIVEDNAHGLFSTYHGKFLGTFGKLATQSFHETKNFTCGEGGALVVNDASLLDRIEIHREKGTNRSQFFRGEVDKYSWVDLGSSWLPSDILAAVLLAQLEHRDEIQERRLALWARYRDALGGWAERVGARLPNPPAHCNHSGHLFQVVLTDLDQRTRLIEHLKARGVLAVFHYTPLHLSEMGQRHGGRVGLCPVAENIADCLLRLPLFNDMSESEQLYVIDAVEAFGG